MLRHRPVILALRRLRKKDLEFKGNILNNIRNNISSSSPVVTKNLDPWEREEQRGKRRERKETGGEEQKIHGRPLEH